MPDTSLGGLSAQQLRKAAALREKIDSLSNQLSRILGSTGKPAAAKRARKPKRKMSAAARAKIAAAQKRRWAKQKKAAKKPASA